MKTANPKRASAGRKGGIATREKYGREIFVIQGKKGGRPRNPTPGEIQAKQPAARRIIVKELPGDLKTLERLWREKRRGTEVIVLPAGASAPERNPSL
jgi:hypothetical protein